MIVGIDLGTSTSEIAILRDGRPTLIREIAGSNLGFLPSVVAVGTDGELRIGEAASGLLAIRPSDSVSEVKRLMGSDNRVTLGGESWTPQEISALILRHLITEAQVVLGEPITEAIITVPAYFNAAQRRATHDAGELAGVKVRRLINEPTAAALAYGIERPGSEEKVLVFDLGGGTFDVTVLELSEGVLDVIASTGNSQLGGKDFDAALMSFLAALCKAATGIDLMSTPKGRGRLKVVAKRAKEDLSLSERVPIALDNLGLRADGSTIDWEYTLTRPAFEAQIEKLVRSTTQQLDEALAVKQLRPGDIQTILMIGGSSRVPLVRQHVSDYFGGRSLRTELHPDEAVALGAAVLSGIEGGSIDPARLVVTDVAPWTLGIAIVTDTDGKRTGGVFSPLIQKQSTVPRTVTHEYGTTRDGQESVLIEVYQGDAALCSDNLKVGEFELQGLERAPAGASVEVSFSYNLSGELEVTARGLGQERRVVMRPNSQQLSEAEKVSARSRLENRWSRSQSSLPDSAASPRAQSTQDRARLSPLYPQIAPLMTRAESALPSLQGGQRARLEVLLLEARAALIAGDRQMLRTVEEALTNLLFELK